MNTRTLVKSNIDNSSLILSLRNLSKNSKESYLRTVRQFEAFTGKNIKLTDESDILDFIEHLEIRGFKNASVNNKRYALQSIFNALQKDNLIKTNPGKELAHKLGNQGKKFNRPVDVKKRELLKLPDIREAIKQQDKNFDYIILKGLRLSCI